jgi:hypothetical protein
LVISPTSCDFMNLCVKFHIHNYIYHIHINFSVIKTLIWQTWRTTCISISDGLIPWSRVVLEKLVVIKVVKNFPKFCGNWSFVTVFTGTQQMFLYWSRWIQSMPSHPLSFKIHLCLHLPSSLFASGSSTKTCMHFSFPP